MQSLSAARLFEDQKAELELELMTESLASRRDVTVADLHRPGMALMGFVENFLPERIQILGQTELSYLAQLGEASMREAIDRLFQFTMPLLMVCKGLDIRPTCSSARTRPNAPSCARRSRPRRSSTR
jgi:HPr kinase/phosphorylase